MGAYYTSCVYPRIAKQVKNLAATAPGPLLALLIRTIADLSVYASGRETIGRGRVDDRKRTFWRLRLFSDVQTFIDGRPTVAIIYSEDGTSSFIIYACIRYTQPGRRDAEKEVYPKNRERA